MYVCTYVHMLHDFLHVLKCMYICGKAISAVFIVNVNARFTYKQGLTSVYMYEIQYAYNGYI